MLLRTLLLFHLFFSLVPGLCLLLHLCLLLISPLLHLCFFSPHLAPLPVLIYLRLLLSTSPPSFVFFSHRFSMHSSHFLLRPLSLALHFRSSDSWPSCITGTPSCTHFCAVADRWNMNIHHVLSVRLLYFSTVPVIFVFNGRMKSRCSRLCAFCTGWCIQKDLLLFCRRTHPKPQWDRLFIQTQQYGTTWPGSRADRESRLSDLLKDTAAIQHRLENPRTTHFHKEQTQNSREM